MGQVPSPIEVTNWPQVAALTILVAAFVVIPAVINYLQNRPIKKTLTQNNGGSSVKDYLDDITARLERLETGAEAPRTLTPPTEREDMHDA